MKNDNLYYAGAAMLCAAMLLGPAQSQAKGRNLNVNSTGNAQTCADLKARTNNGEVAQAVDQFTLQRREAPTLEISGGTSTVISVSGWDRSEYSVEACKFAVAGDRAAAEQLVKGISVNHSAGRVLLNEPAASGDAQWQVYFFVHAPKDGSLDLDTKNGPVSVRDVSNGTLKVRAANGPVSIANCGGTIDAHTTNGPISFSGSGGEVHLTANNGPISLKLSGDVWNGSQLDARTVNGPVSLSLPATFQSGVRVETSPNAPISCRIAACRGAQSESTQNLRTLQFNGSHELVRVSTSRGPVSVNSTVKQPRVI